RKAPIGEGEIAEKEYGAARGFERAGMQAIGAQAGRETPSFCTFFLIHKSSISQEAAEPDARIWTRPLPWAIETLIEVESPYLGRGTERVRTETASTKGQFHEQRRSPG